MTDYATYGIKIPSGSHGNVKATCPACTPHNRKVANKNAKDLSVNTDQGIWQCWNCGWSGTLKQREERNYTKPVEIKLQLSDKTVEWFKNRGINANTLKKFGITEKSEWMPQEGKEMNCICFPYLKDDKWTNIKFRDGKKNFKMVKDAELLIFNYDGVNGKKKVIITEGEIDAMSVYEAGFFDVCSVPNGASKGNQRLEYLDNSWAAFSESEEIVIATDNDEAGINLKNELIRRLGRDRCQEFIYPAGCKDLNEVLVKYGIDGIWGCINKSKPLPVEGICRLTDFVIDLDSVYAYGFPPGVTIGYSDFDNLLNFSTGQLTVITGIPNSGKSAFMDQVLLKLAERHGWNIGVCSFENQPITKHAANLAACYVGMPFYRKDDNSKMSPESYENAKKFLYDHFFWFKMKDEDLSCEGIVSRGKQLVKTHGIKALVIDPWNYMEHKRGNNMTETEYVSDVLSRLCNFAKDYDVHVFLVAHPTKIRKDPATGDFEIPNLYNISGSAHFFNKCDNGFTVYRDRKTNLVTVYIQKVRFFYNGSIGSAEFTYDVHSGRYRPAGNIVEIQPTNGMPNRLPYKDDPF